MMVLAEPALTITTYRPAASWLKILCGSRGFRENLPECSRLWMSLGCRRRMGA